MKSFFNKEYLANKKVDFEKIDETICEYLKRKEGKKVSIFSDFDPKAEIERLSQNCEIYWFCFETRNYYNRTSLENFKGHFYNTRNIRDSIEHLKNIDKPYYERRERKKREGEEISDGSR